MSGEAGAVCPQCGCDHASAYELGRKDERMAKQEQAERTFSGTGNVEVDKLIANTVQRSIDLLVLLRDVATVLGLREDSDQKTIRRLKEYVKVGMRRPDHTIQE